MGGMKKKIKLKNEGKGDLMELLMITTGLFTMLPIDLVRDILSRLPVKDVRVCQMVCKGWLHLIRQPCFAKAHYDKQIQNRFHDYPYVVLVNSCAQFCLVDNVVFDDSNPSPVHGRQLKALNKNFSYLIGEEFKPCQVLGSANGFICLSSPPLVPYYICNPITGESITLPKSPMHKIKPVNAVLGFTPTSVEYKVIRLLSLREARRVKAIAEIYTLGSGRWRRIEDVPCIIQQPVRSVAINEKFYWIANSPETTSVSILSLNVGTEEFIHIKPPTDMKLKVIHGYRYNYQLTVSRERLCFIVDDPAYGYGMWEMGDDGAQECWTKKLLLLEKENVLGRLCCGFYDVVKLANGEFRVDEKKVHREMPYYYDHLKKKAVKKIKFGWALSIQDIRPIILTPTLFSPKNVCKPSSFIEQGKDY